MMKAVREFWYSARVTLPVALASAGGTDVR